MRFSLRTFLIAFSIIGVTYGWFGSRYLRMQKERQILADLSPGICWDFVARAYSADDELYQRYDADRLFDLADRYSKIAEREPTESVPAKIAAAALFHSDSRYDMPRKEFIDAPKAAELAEKYYDSKIEPLASASTMILMRQCRFSDDIHSSQDCRSGFEDGFDADDPFDVYVLVTEVCSDFNYGDEAYGVAEDWPLPGHPWGWHLDESAAHTYEDKIEALRQVSPRAADVYASIVGEVRTCKEVSAELSSQRLSDLSQELMLALDEPSIFRFMLKNRDVFKSNPKLLLPRLPDSQTTSNSPPKQAEK